MTFAERIEGIASRAGLNVTARNPSYVTCGFQLAAGRSQMVHLMPAGQLLNQTVVNISTPVIELHAGELPGNVGDGLLAANGNFMIGSFGIVQDSNKRVLMFRHNMILETLDPEEFRAVVATLAHTGDEWERKLGGNDRF